jgi:Ni/Fe-hydrogenase subunit HybB-like protein
MGGIMASLTQTKKSALPISFFPYLALALLAVGLSIYRLVVGLGPTTNMSDHYPWGIWITIDLFLIPVAGAAFTISLISFFFGYEDYRTVLRPAVVAGFLGYSVVGILLFLDIGRWPQFYNILDLGIINPHSFLEEISLCVTLYVVILTLEVLPILFEHSKFEKYVKWIETGIYFVAGAGILLSTLHQSSLGSMFLLMRHKLHPLWYTPALPLLFFLQAGYTGLGTTVIAITLVWRSKSLPTNRLLIRRIGQAMGINLLLYASIRIGDWMGAGEIPMLLKPNAFGWIAWLEFGLGILVPLAILFSKLVRHSQGPLWASVFALMGTFINRLMITWVGLSEPSPVTYFPSWIEIMITIGLIAGGALVYERINYYFRLLPEKHEKHQ